LKDKNVLFLGSSVTYGAAAGGVSFVEIMAEKCGFTFVKEAVSGTTLAQTLDNSYVKRLKDIDTNIKFDLFVCQLSTNDSYRKVPLDDTKEAIIYIINYVKEKFGCPIVFYTGTRFANGEKYDEQVNFLYEIKDEYGFYLLDLWNDEEMQNIDPVLYKEYMQDPVHPTYKGYEQWWTPKFIDCITKNI
ncbi:MAG: SGNH/GDSL hydrolase family protein, partial [Clostridia bacterium]|nr:SGNH/GDSL hydrolase family protein [Clostridia bacterium]